MKQAKVTNQPVPRDIVREVEQPKRGLYKWLKDGFDSGKIKPGGKVILVR